MVRANRLPDAPLTEGAGGIFFLRLLNFCPSPLLGYRFGAEKNIRKLWKLKWNKNVKGANGSPNSWFGLYLRFWDHSLV